MPLSRQIPQCQKYFNTGDPFGSMYPTAPFKRDCTNCRCHQYVFNGTGNFSGVVWASTASTIGGIAGIFDIWLLPRYCPPFYDPITKTISGSPRVIIADPINAGVVEPQPVFEIEIKEIRESDFCMHLQVNNTTPSGFTCIGLMMPDFDLSAYFNPSLHWLDLYPPRSNSLISATYDAAGFHKSSGWDDACTYYATTSVISLVLSWTNSDATIQGSRACLSGNALAGDVEALMATTKGWGAEYPAKPGVVSIGWHKTGDTTGTATLAAGHNQISGTYNISWSGGSRTGTAGNVVGNTIAFAGGTGDNTPADDTVISITNQADILTFYVSFSHNIMWWLKDNFSTIDTPEVTHGGETYGPWHSIPNGLLIAREDLVPGSSVSLRAVYLDYIEAAVPHVCNIVGPEYCSNLGDDGPVVCEYRWPGFPIVALCHGLIQSPWTPSHTFAGTVDLNFRSYGGGAAIDLGINQTTDLGIVSLFYNAPVSSSDGVTELAEWDYPGHTLSNIEKFWSRTANLRENVSWCIGQIDPEDDEAYVLRVKKDYLDYRTPKAVSRSGLTYNQPSVNYDGTFWKGLFHGRNADDMAITTYDVSDIYYTVYDGYLTEGNTVPYHSLVLAHGSPLTTTGLAEPKLSTGWTKTGDTTGTATLAAGHGLASGAYYITWSSGGGGSRSDATGTVDGNAISFSGGTGDNTPADDTSVSIICQTAYRLLHALNYLSYTQAFKMKWSTADNNYIYDSGDPTITENHTAHIGCPPCDIFCLYVFRGIPSPCLHVTITGITFSGNFAGTTCYNSIEFDMPLYGWQSKCVYEADWDYQGNVHIDWADDARTGNNPFWETAHADINLGGVELVDGYLGPGETLYLPASVMVDDTNIPGTITQLWENPRYTILDGPPPTGKTLYQIQDHLHEGGKVRGSRMKWIAGSPGYWTADTAYNVYVGFGLRIGTKNLVGWEKRLGTHIQVTVPRSGFQHVIGTNIDLTTGEDELKGTNESEFHFADFSTAIVHIQSKYPQNPPTGGESILQCGVHNSYQKSCYGCEDPCQDGSYIKVVFALENDPDPPHCQWSSLNGTYFLRFEGSQNSSPTAPICDYHLDISPPIRINCDEGGFIDVGNLHGWLFASLSGPGAVISYDYNKTNNQFCWVTEGYCANSYSSGIWTNGICLGPTPPGGTVTVSFERP